MTSTDRTATESKIHQLISDMQMSLQSLQRGVDETTQLWRGQAGDQLVVSSVHGELAAGRALLDEMRATVAAPPWGGAAG